MPLVLLQIVQKAKSPPFAVRLLILITFSKPSWLVVIVSASEIGDGGPLAEGEHRARRERVEIGIVHGGLPSFRSCSGGETLRAAITHYKAIVVLQVTMSIKCCLKGIPGPAYIGG